MVLESMEEQKEDEAEAIWEGRLGETEALGKGWEEYEAERGGWGERRSGLREEDQRMEVGVEGRGCEEWGQS